MTYEQPEALQLADFLSRSNVGHHRSAAELRRLHVENEALKAERAVMLAALQNADALILQLLPGVRRLVSTDSMFLDDIESMLNNLTAWQTNRKIIEKE